MADDTPVTPSTEPRFKPFGSIRCAVCNQMTGIVTFGAGSRLVNALIIRQGDDECLVIHRCVRRKRRETSRVARFQDGPDDPT